MNAKLTDIIGACLAVRTDCLDSKSYPNCKSQKVERSAKIYSVLCNG